MSIKHIGIGMTIVDPLTKAIGLTDVVQLFWTYISNKIS